MSGSLNGHGRHRKLCSKLKPVFGLLLEAFDYAEDADGDRWEFAVPRRQLLELGMSDNDLRWLVRKGYVEHACEVIILGTDGRDFQPTGDLTFSKRTCFVLTDAGASKAVSVANGQRESDNGCQEFPSTGTSETQRNGAESNGHAKVTPKWDPEIRSLRIDDTVVKRFKWRAANQEAVLNAFHEEGWPQRIDDPLPPHPEQDSKRRLSDTIKCLNKNQTHQLIRFHGDGTGEGVTWELLDPVEDGEQ